MTDDLRNGHGIPLLQVIAPSGQHAFETPSKRINDGDDLSFFLRSSAYADIMTWIIQLNRAMVPIKRATDSSLVDTWPLRATNMTISPEVAKLSHLIRSLDGLMEKAPPAIPSLLQDALSDKLWGRARNHADLDALNLELAAYLLASFGSPERLDYGTGHELSFLAFLACVWKLGGFAHADSGVQERAIVTAVIQP
jgi:serine/threonine-protein phosphatase 2A activator